MIHIHKIHIANAAVIILILYLQTALEVANAKKVLCPIGFRVGNDTENYTICYRKKGPETFAEKFENCAGNLYSLSLLQKLNLPSSNHLLWADYKNIYDGGPFVDWSYTKKAGVILESTYEVNRDSIYNVNEELCVAVDLLLNLTSVRCNEKHYRYCVIKPYEEPDNMDSEGCDGFSNPIPTAVEFDFDFEPFNTYRFRRPKSTCLLKAMPASGSKVRMTWKQSQKACEIRGGSLLNRGWIYSNFPLFSDNDDGSYPLFPFGVVLSADLKSLQYNTTNDTALIPPTEWLFESTLSNDTRLGAVTDDYWELVNSSNTFFDVICEKTVPLRSINMTLYADDSTTDKDNIILTLDQELTNDKKNIQCFTDASGYVPVQVMLSKIKGKSVPHYKLKLLSNGYYWCTHTDTTNYYITETNKILHIKNITETENLYSVKLTSLARDYNLKNVANVLKDWKKKIEEYVFYSTKYRKTYASDTYDNHSVWMFKNEAPDSSVKNAHVELKRVYLNSRSALLHVKLHPNMLPVVPGQWNDIRIDSMKPAYLCEKDEHLVDYPRLALGETKQSFPCKIFKCVGDFNEGVQLVMSNDDMCYTPMPLSLGSTVTVNDTDLPTSPVVSSTEPSNSDSEEYTTRQHKPSLELNSSDSSEEEDKMKAIVEATDEPTQANQSINEDFTPEVTTAYTVDSEEVTEETTIGVISDSGIQGPSSFRPPRPSTTPTPVITAYPTYPPTTTPIPRPPEEELEQVMKDLNTLLNATNPILVADIDSSFNQVDGFLADNENLEIPGDLLHILDDIGARLNLNGSRDGSSVKRNIALVVADALPESPVRGLKIVAGQVDTFTPDAFQILRDDINDSHLMSDMNEVVIQLPESIALSNRRISFVVFRNDRAFQRSHYSVNSKVLSINIENTTEFYNGEAIDIYLTPINDIPERNSSRSCAFWKFLDDGSGRGYWAQDGCIFIPSSVDGMLDTCRCTHLTHFAEVLIPRTVFSERSENALETLSIVGCITSIIGLILVGVTALTFRSWRRDYSNKIWLQLCTSIFIMSLSFLVIIYAHFEVYDVLCMLTGIVLHFSVLSSFCWMLVAAVLSYRRLVTVFTQDKSHKLLRASAFAWGVPCAVVGILLSVAPHSYSGRFDDKNPTAAFCYPSGLALWLSVFAPLAVMLVVNWTLFALIVRSVFASRRNHPNRVGHRHSGDKHEALRCASVSFFLVFLFGLPWLLGLFAMNEVMAYFFVILSTFQGFVLFLFFVLGNKKTRDLWLNKLKIKQTRKVPVTSSTYTNNRSTGGGVTSRSANQPVTIEKKISKPRSLVSLDDSRFS